MIVGDNHFIQNKILASVAVLERVPQLSTLKAKVVELNKRCGSCGGDASAQKQLDQVWNQIREFLVHLPDADKSFIREKVANNQIVRISYRSGKGTETRIKAGNL